jgi:hypothetical protein
MAWTTPAFGQSDRGSVTGTVTDPGGAVVVGAKITATSLETNEVREATSSDEGNYTLPELRAGLYRVTVEAQGFKSATFEDFKVAVQTTRSLDVTLEVGAITDVVTVTSDSAPVIQTDSPVRQTNVNERQVRELPLQVSAESGGRTPLAFIFLDSNVSAASGTSGRGTDASNFRVSGGQGLGTEITIDGASTRRAQNGTFFSEVAPGPNAFKEFTISTSSYSAEFGSSSGGIIGFSLKSGQNEFHGEVYDLFRNEAFNANSFFNNAQGVDANGTQRNPRPRDHQHNFGGNVGGPIYFPRFGEGGPAIGNGRDRAFFFFNYEGFRFSRTENVDITVPTLRMRSGDFSELFTDPYVVDYYRLNNISPQIYDPTMPAATRLAIPGNRLDLYRNPITGQSVIDPAGFALMNFYPLPTSGGVFRNYRANSTTPTTMNNYIGKTDFIISDKQRVAISYSYRKLDSIKAIRDAPAFTRLPPPYTASFDGNGPFEQFFKSHIARVQHDYNFTPTLLNHFNAGFTRYDVANRNFSEGIPASSVGVPANATQNVALPRIGFPGYGDRGGDPSTSLDPRAVQGAGSSFFSDAIRDNAVQLSDFVSWTKGRHTMKFGADIRFQQLNIRQAIDPGGSFNFRNEQTSADRDPNGGHPLASLITGATEFSFVNIRTVDPAFRYFYPAFFFTDDFKVTQRLTLNLGVRYEIPYPRRDAFNRLRGFSPTAINPVVGRRGALVSASGLGGLQAEHESLVEPDYSNIGPRVGFAYSLNSRTVVRGGFGLYYAPVLYGAGGINSISEGFLGYNNGANPDSNPPRRPGGRNFETNTRESPFFLRNVPPAPAIDPTGQFIGSDVEYFNEDFKTGRTAQWSLDVQRELPANFAVSIGYIGHKATRLRSDFNRPNALPLDALKLGFPLLARPLREALADPKAVSYAQSVGVPLPASNAAVFPGFEGSVAESLKPFPQYGRIINQLESQGQSWYNALQAKVDRRFSQGIQFGASYTFSKLITTASEDLFGGSPLGGVLQNPYDRGGIRSVSPNNPYHVFVFNYLLELPFGRGKRFLNSGGIVDKIFGGFQLSGIHRYQSGLPLTVLDSEPGRAGFLSLVGFGGNIRPNLTGQPILTDDDRNGTRFQLVNIGAFTPAPLFATPALGIGDIGSANYRSYYANPNIFFGNAPAVFDNARSLPFYSENISLIKKTRLTETTTLELRGEAFNVFNRHRYFAPANDLRFGDFGQSAVINNDIAPPRVIQLGVRFTF